MELIEFDELPDVLKVDLSPSRYPYTYHHDFRRRGTSWSRGDVAAKCHMLPHELYPIDLMYASLVVISEDHSEAFLQALRDPAFVCRVQEVMREYSEHRVEIEEFWRK